MSSGGDINAAESGRSSPGGRTARNSNIIKQITDWNNTNESSTDAHVILR